MQVLSVSFLIGNRDYFFDKNKRREENETSSCSDIFDNEYFVKIARVTGVTIGFIKPLIIIIHVDYGT